MVSGRMVMNCEGRMCNSVHIMGTRDSVADRPKGLPGGAYEPPAIGRIRNDRVHGTKAAPQNVYGAPSIVRPGQFNQASFLRDQLEDGAGAICAPEDARAVKRTLPEQQPSLR